MSEIVYTITNPLKFFTEEFLYEKLINFGFPEEVVSIHIIKTRQMEMEIELYFTFKEMGEKFYTKYNGKSIGYVQNYK